MDIRKPCGRTRYAVVVAAVGLLLPFSSTPSVAIEVPGGKNPASDCYARLDVTGAQSASSPSAIECTDGDASCDQDGSANNTCLFKVALCLNRTDSAPTCSPPSGGLTKVKPKGILKRLGLAVPALTSSDCGTALTNVAVKTKRKGKKAGKKKVSVLAVGPAAPKKDNDKVTLICNPSGTTSTTLPSGTVCPANPAGPTEPSQIVLTVKDRGTDLDNGWQGPSFNFPTPKDTTLALCLKDCNDGTSGTPDPECVTNVVIGQGTFNGRYFGPPLPLFAADVPVCVLNEYQPDQPNLTGTANLQTGTIDGEIRLFSNVFLTEEEFVCPKCLNGRCNDGPRQGQSCRVDGTVTVARSTAADKTFPLSKDCPPFANSPAGVLDIRLPLTTGTSTLDPNPSIAGSTDRTPCGKLASEALIPAPDKCGSSGTCNVGGCSGPQTCASMGSDPVSGAAVCVDAKGGLSQACCSTDAGVACHPTRSGARIIRTGSAEPPKDSGGMGYGSGSYPKTSNLVNVATFCERATGTASVDGLTGLPGPGALILPNVAVWDKPSQ